MNNLKFFLLFIICFFSFIFVNATNASQLDTTTQVREKISVLNKKIQDIDDKLSITQKDIFNSYNRNIQMMVEDHQKSQANFNTMYNIIYGFFGFILILLSLSGYIGFTTLKDLKKYARERIDSLVQKEVSNVHNEAQKKLNELGLDSDGISCTMKEVMRLQ